MSPKPVSMRDSVTEALLLNVKTTQVLLYHDSAGEYQYARELSDELPTCLNDNTEYGSTDSTLLTYLLRTDKTMKAQNSAGPHHTPHPRVSYRPCRATPLI